MLSVTAAEFSYAIAQPRLEAALRRRVGRGKPRSREQLADETGYVIRTIDGWLNDGRMPDGIGMLRLAAVFGLDFISELMTGVPPSNIVDIGRRA